MIKFVIPAIIILLIVFFWEKINEIIYNKFNVKINYIVITNVLIFFGIVFALLYFWDVINEKLENERNF